jgi:HTH-type transcriptional regulator/antitoxin HigA
MKTNRKPIKLTKEIIPAHATHPGQLLADEIEYRDIKQKDLADAMDISTNILSELIHEKRNITPAIAMKLEKALDIDAIYWMRLQVKYYIDKMKIEQKEQIAKAHISKKLRGVFSSRVFHHA